MLASRRECQFVLEYDVEQLTQPVVDVSCHDDAMLL